MSTEKPPFAYKAARFSLWVPVIILAWTILVDPVLNDSLFKYFHAGRFVVGAVKMTFVLIAFALGIYALISMRKHGTKGLLGYGVAGVGINGLILISSMIAIFFMSGFLRQQTAGITREEADAIPLVFKGGTVLYHEKIGYRVEIPDGFEPEQVVDARALQGLHYAYARSCEDGSNIVIHINELGGRIPYKLLSSKDKHAFLKALPPGSTVDVLVERWNGYDINLMRSRIPVGEDGFVISHAYQVPLARGAVQLSVAAMEEHEAEGREVARAVLGALHGKSNWVK